LNNETRPKEDKERYYVLWKEVGVADQLSEYGSQNTLTESVVIGKLSFRLCIVSTNACKKQVIICGVHTHPYA